MNIICYLRTYLYCIYITSKYVKVDNRVVAFRQLANWRFNEQFYNVDDFVAFWQLANWRFNEQFYNVDDFVPGDSGRLANLVD